MHADLDRGLGHAARPRGLGHGQSLDRRLDDRLALTLGQPAEQGVEVAPRVDGLGYNAVQRAAYLFVVLDCVLLVLSGLVVWKSVQFPLLRGLLGGHDLARYIHFFAMSALVAFVAVHLVMVALVPRSLLTMIRGH